MLASVAASPVSWPGPWHARVRPASEPAFQPLMACGCFFTTVPGSGLPAGVCLCWGCQCPRRARSCCLCCPASVIRCSYKRAREIRVPCVRVLDRSVFLSGYRSCPLWVCLHFPGPASLWCMFLSRSSRLVFVTIAVVPPALSSFPGTFRFG